MFNDPFFFGGGFSSLPSELGIFVSGSLVVAIIAVLFSGRGDDRASARPAARYLGAIGLLTLFVALFAAFAAVHSLTDLLVDHETRYDSYNAQYDANAAPGVLLPVAPVPFDFSTDPSNNTNYAAAVASGLVALTAGGIFFVHARARRRLMDGPNGKAESVSRVDRTYHYGRCFVAALVISVALTTVGFGLFELIAPGIAIGGSAKVVRAEGISEMLSFGLLAAAALLVFLRSWNTVRGDLGMGRARPKK